MTTESKEPKDKAGYVCPTCRMVFSLPTDLGGNGVSCPGCENLLTIPTLADKVSEIGVTRSVYSSAKTEVKAKEVVKHHRALSQGEHHEWSDENLEHGGDKSLRIMLPIALVSMLLLGGLGYLLLFSNNDKGREAMVVVDEVENAEGESGEESYSYDPDDKDEEARLEEFLTGFFATKTVDEMLPYVRPVDNIREKMVKFYKGEAITQSSFNSLNRAYNTPKLSGYLTFEGQTLDYNTHIGALKYGREEILLDWESFVGFSDMTWAELAEKKPVEPVNIRVTAKRAYYYNNAFTDEAVWQAVSLISPNEEDPVYGYVEKGSATEQILFNFNMSDNRSVVLAVSFPEDAKKGDQVYINSVVEQGWIITEEK